MEGDDGVKDCMRLTSTEILILTVLSSQGLPVFSDDWNSLVGSDILAMDNQNGEEEDFKIYFSAMGGVMLAAAEVVSY